MCAAPLPATRSQWVFYIAGDCTGKLVYVIHDERMRDLVRKIHEGSNVELFHVAVLMSFSLISAAFTTHNVLPTKHVLKNPFGKKL